MWLPLPAEVDTLIMNSRRRPQASAPAARGRNTPPIGSRIAASGALIVFLATLAGIVLFSTKNGLFVVVSLLFTSLGISAVWIAATNRRSRWWAGVEAVVLVGSAIASLVGYR